MIGALALSSSIVIGPIDGVEDHDGVRRPPPRCVGSTAESVQRPRNAATPRHDVDHRSSLSRSRCELPEANGLGRARRARERPVTRTRRDESSTGPSTPVERARRTARSPRSGREGRARHRPVGVVRPSVIVRSASVPHRRVSCRGPCPSASRPRRPSPGSAGRARPGPFPGSRGPCRRAAVGQDELAHVVVQDGVVGRLAEPLVVRLLGLARPARPPPGSRPGCRRTRRAGSTGRPGRASPCARSSALRLSPRYRYRIHALLLTASTELAWVFRTRSYCSTALRK